MQDRQVALDGPVASGKTTLAQLLARKLGYLYLDTGAMYRAVALLALENGVDADNEAALVRLYREHRIDIVADAAAVTGYRVLIDGRDRTDRLFGTDVTSMVSTVAAHPAVRAALVERQQEIARSGPVVMAGRDIGTVVLPEARHKFFLTASVEERVKRRRAELAAAGVAVDSESLRRQIEERDRLDASRPVAPLRPAADAVTIDSTAMSIDDVVATMLERIGEGARP
jgi:cytidylate kinase